MDVVVAQGRSFAYLVRTEKERTLIVQNVLTRNIEVRIPMKSVDEPESPCFSPDGKTIVFSGLRRHRRHLHRRSRHAAGHQPHDRRLLRLRSGLLPDGKFVVYNARVSGNQKLFRLDLDTKKKTQLTFGTNDESAAQFFDQNTLLFSSTATNPNQPLDPEVAKNANIYNAWTLDLKSGELKQIPTRSAASCRPSCCPIRPAPRSPSSATTKGEHWPARTRAQGSRLPPPPAPTSARPVPSSTSRRRCSTRSCRRTSARRAFEKMFLEGRPPVSARVGVTNSGDVFGGTEISFGDVLGDKQVNFSASIAQYARWRCRA